MATFNKFNTFVEYLAEGGFNFSSDSTCTITVALCAAANAPVATNGVLGDLTTIDHTNLSSRVVGVSSSSQTSGTYKLIINDLVLTASGAVPTFRYVVFYDDDNASDALIGWYDYGGNVDLATGETFTIDASPTNGLFQLV